MPSREPPSKWSALIGEWKRTQSDLRERIRFEPLDPLPRFVAGVDAAFGADGETVLSAAVVFDRTENRIVEVAHAVRPLEFPYIPGFLSFREGPAVLEAIGNLTHPFGAICFDGQGYAHPRRCGLASHMAVTLDVPGIGVAKARFIGTHAEPGAAAGDSVPLLDKDEQVGIVLRTKAKTKPLYVSVGHRVDLPSAAALVLACCTRYRIPEPTRQADIEVARLKRTLNEIPDASNSS